MYGAPYGVAPSLASGALLYTDRVRGELRLLRVMDLPSPNVLVYAGLVEPTGVTIVGDLAYVACGRKANELAGSILFFDVSSMLNPRRAKKKPTKRKLEVSCADGHRGRCATFPLGLASSTKGLFVTSRGENIVCVMRELAKRVTGVRQVFRQRTVVHGERASRSIVNRTTALWSIWMVASLILAGLE